MSIRLQLLALLLCMTTAVVIGIPLFVTLSESECNAYFASHDLAKISHAMYVCPKKLRPKVKDLKLHFPKRTAVEEDYIEEEPDDFYVFW